ncbi:NagC family transcriptional regulator [Methanobrevibacter arboriphilus]|mgnify:CR=1 FL=1|jgi:nascent polypeptide-associated complex subunit alpha|uniref:NagC family transcriptional regulator n=1 Tax=Methanobrevibacter arboriphilus TaxID=39441 RepID=A0ACA8R6G3_METAZ|nr:nascent polypeptide-associated complex protein [Methanobrevibacter arboriphilus]MCC7562286.1 nascent polypeptide-associated complex protein [Methanobrevibacter arboriphilus]BBL62980.1 NagC family transcriptional regulator [Methanobrevibacter arboriphilus]GLI12135.1 NagC family transcriptional regulator [Methanobrevibacter arboriphilus]
MIPGMNPKQMKQMERQMKKMGMEMKDLPDVKEVIIRFEDKELVIPDAEVNLMNVMGQETYQVTGTAVEVEIDAEIVIPDEDIEMVANQAGVSKVDAEEALISTNGDLAEAILKLSQ